MGWLLDNSLADMRGPDFLMFYGIFACVVLIGAYFYLETRDTTGGMTPPPTPRDIDPYELSYLRGGINEIIRTVIYALRQKGLIAFEKGRIQASGVSAQELAPIERLVFDAVSPAPKIAALFADRDLRNALERLCGAAKQRLSAQQLLAPPEIRRAGYFALAIAGGLLVAFAAYKAWAAIMHGRSNLGFLFIETAWSCGALFLIFRKKTASVASKRGKAFLAQIQLAYSGHVGAVFGAATEGIGGSAAAGGAALLMVGLFGFAILKGTPDAALAQAFAQSSGSGGDGGGGCGGGGGGGCGGCGGGGGD
ncbi:TIGR04222 domain-containing membrane protein [Methylocapsa sp. S129]|uniref:TIGR04222 domain-containing membrane protein n=1 Tax=Methylocapsa sp. S129 TaxID=1641869 RepID=UPI00157610E7|nr:TIGR04222 domain-containing membrane protein [Methylocapsa sp. S129]